MDLEAVACFRSELPDKSSAFVGAHLRLHPIGDSQDADRQLELKAIIGYRGGCLSFLFFGFSNLPSLPSLPSGAIYP